jgi:hypothetical protein
LATVLIGTGVAVAAPPPAADSDSDDDGLSNFHEIHKYRTDPKKKDTVGDGVPDGDPNQKGLTHHQTRHAIVTGLSAAGNSFANHTYLEVYVGHRWRRLNYTKLSQDVLDPRYFGLMVYVAICVRMNSARSAAYRTCPGVCGGD